MWPQCVALAVRRQQFFARLDKAGNVTGHPFAMETQHAQNPSIVGSRVE
jgi:hypothetical protein